MSWDLIEGEWPHFKIHVKKQWDKLTDDHLDLIAGKRHYLVKGISKNYGIREEEAECQVRDWEDRNKDVFAETAASIRKLPKSLHGSTE